MASIVLIICVKMSKSLVCYCVLNVTIDPKLLLPVFIFHRCLSMLNYIVTYFLKFLAFY